MAVFSFLQITHFIMMLFVNTIIGYKFSSILVNFNDAILHPSSVYNSSLATILTSKQNEIVSNLCNLNGINNCWIEFHNNNTYMNRNINDKQQLNSANCVEISANTYNTKNKWNIISCDAEFDM
eukprot:303208_1